MHHYTIHLTNGLFVPAYQIDKDPEDLWLHHLGNYLHSFVNLKNVRSKIKGDFELDTLFEESKQT